MKKVFIYAYTQMNLGDDLFIKILCDRYPGTKFYIVSDIKYSSMLKTISNLVVFPKIPLIDGLIRRLGFKFNINSFISNIVSCFSDAVVNIGGSLFIENKAWEYTTHQYRKRIIYSKPYYIIGSNFGPFKNIDYYNTFKSIFKQVTDICFRDKYSYDLFSDMENVRYAPDVIFLYSDRNVCEEKKQIVISVIDLTKRPELRSYEIEYLDKILEVSRYFIQKGYDVCLMGFCEYEGDGKAILQILSKAGTKELSHIKPYYYLGDMERSIKLIRESEYVIASRFHAMILGWVFKKPVYPIVYSEKSINVIRDIEFNGKYGSIQHINEHSAEEIFEYLVTSEPLNIQRQADLVKEQFRLLDDLML